MMNKPAAFIMVEGGRTWFRTSAETEEAIRTGFIMETVPLYTAPPKREPLSDEEIKMKWDRLPTNTKDPIIRFARAIEKAHGIGVDDE
jgi:hypothetical protein